jgi:hypothetical protein
VPDESIFEDALDPEPAVWKEETGRRSTGPKQRRGPNDDELALEASLGRPPTPEERAQLQDARAVRDAERLEQTYAGDREREESPTPLELEDDDPPEPVWQVFPDYFGPKVDRVLYRGEPVGQFLDREHHDASGQGVHDLLVSLDAPEQVAVAYARRRANRDMELGILQSAGHPAFEGAVQRDTDREAKMDPVRKAFIKSMQEKQKKK